MMSCFSVNRSTDCFVEANNRHLKCFINDSEGQVGMNAAKFEADGGNVEGKLPEKKKKKQPIILFLVTLLACSIILPPNYCRTDRLLFII